MEIFQKALFLAIECENWELFQKLCVMGCEHSLGLRRFPNLSQFKFTDESDQPIAKIFYLSHEYKR